MRLSRSAHLLMCLSLETLVSIVKTSWPILVEVADRWTLNIFQTVNFPTPIPGRDSHSPTLLDLFLLTLVFFLQWLSFNEKILIMFLSLNSVHLMMLMKFWVGPGWNWCIYPSLVKPYSSPWFSAPCAAARAYRNHFLRLCKQDKSSESKVKFRQASNRCKRVLEAAKLTYANKAK